MSIGFNKKQLIAQADALSAKLSSQGSPYPKTKYVIHALKLLADQLPEIEEIESLIELRQEVKNLGASLNELELEIESFFDDYQAPEFINDGYEFVSALSKTIETIRNSTDQVVNDFTSLSEVEQAQLLKEDIPHSMFLTHLPKLSPLVQKILFFQLAKKAYLDIEEPLKEALEAFPEFRLILAKRTKQTDLILELLLVKDNAVEEVFLARHEEVDLFDYWGLLSHSTRKKLIHQISSLESFNKIERFLTFHATLDEATTFWGEIFKLPIKEAVLNKVQEGNNYSYLQSRYPNLFP